MYRENISGKCEIKKNKYLGRRRGWWACREDGKTKWWGAMSTTEPTREAGIVGKKAQTKKYRPGGKKRQQYYGTINIGRTQKKVNEKHHST